MKIISLWEPWASLLSIGAKRIETRSWYTSYRGWLAIHASKGGLSQTELRQICSEEPFWSVLEGSFAEDAKRGFVFPHGHIVAIVRLIACAKTEWLTAPAGAEVVGADLINPQELTFGDFHEGRYGWVTDSLFRLREPIPFKGQQGLSDVPSEVVEQIRGQWRKAFPPAEVIA